MIYIMLGSIIGIRLGIYKDISLFILAIIIMFLIYILNTRKNLNPKDRYFLRKEIFLIDYLPFIKIKDILAFVISTMFFVVYINVFETRYINFENNLLLKNKYSYEKIYILSKRESEYNKIYTVYLIDEKAFGDIKCSKKNKESLKVGKAYLGKVKFNKLEDEFNPKGFIERKYNLSRFKKFKGKGEFFKEKNIYVPVYIKALGNILKLKEDIYLNYGKYIKEKIALGITLGDKEFLEKDILEDFKKLNIYHILSVSGMHVSILIFILSNLKMYFKKIIKIKGLDYVLDLINLIILISYIILTSFSVSTIRAFLMYYLAVIFRKLNLSVRFIDILAFVFVLNVLINPYLIFFAGIYLSFMAVFGIKITRYILETKNALILILVINILMQPVLIYFTSILSLNFLLGNIVITSFSTCIIILTNIFILLFSFNIIIFKFNLFISVILKYILTPIYSLLAFGINVLNKVLIFLIKALKPLTFEDIYMESFSLYFYIIYYILIYFIFKSIKIMKKKKEYLMLNIFEGESSEEE